MIGYSFSPLNKGYHFGPNIKDFLVLIMNKPVHSQSFGVIVDEVKEIWMAASLTHEEFSKNANTKFQVQADENTRWNWI